MKKIVFLLVSYGEDGKGKRSIDHASFDEMKIDKKYNESAYTKAFYMKEEAIIDTEEEKKKALSKINAIEKLVLDIKE